MKEFLRSQIERLYDFNAFKRYFSSIGFLILEKIVRLVLNSFVVGVLVANYLEPELYGELNYYLSLVFFGTILVIAGLPNVVVKYFAHLHRNKKVVFWTALHIQGLGFLIYISLALVGSFLFIDSIQGRTITVILALAQIHLVSKPLEMLLMGESKGREVSIVYLIQSAISIGLKVYGVYMHLPLTYFAWIFLIEGIVLAVGLLYYGRNYVFPAKGFRIAKGLAVRMAKEGAPILLSSVMVILYLRLDIIMLEHLQANPDELGWYALAVKLSESYQFLPVILLSTFSPRIHEAKGSLQLYKKRIKHFLGLQLGLSFLGAIGVIALGFIITAFFLDNFDPTLDILLVHAWSAIGVFLGTGMGAIIVAENRQKLSIYATSLGLLVNVVLNFYLIPRYGGWGAAVSTTISYFVVLIPYISVLFSIFTRKEIEKAAPTN